MEVLTILTKTTDRYIYILLTRSPYFLSRLLRVINCWTYSHASIGVDGLDGEFYSFVTKGFRIELPYKYQLIRGKDVHCSLYKINVSHDDYNKIISVLEHFKEKKNWYKYNYTGIVGCTLGIATSEDDRYFCSEFVAHILKTSGVLTFNKNNSIVAPDDFMTLKNIVFEFKGTLRELMTGYKQINAL